MKISTITCHNVYNYGATLQAFALQEYLKSVGHTVEIIDYCPNYHTPFNCWRIGENSKVYNICHRFFIMHLLYAIHRVIKILQDTNFNRVRKFNQFNKKYLNLTANKYKTYKELCNNPPVADAYIAGSDQIWNYKGGCGLDPAFYLNFGLPSIKRYSYAASFGISSIEDLYRNRIKTYLSVFNEISVRENTGLSILKSLNIENGIQVLDPVFLLSKDKWLSFIKNEKKIISYDYLLVYDFFQDDIKINEMAMSLADKYKLRVISVNNNGKLPYANTNICDASPFNFLSLIKNAKYVISNSFHATAFSIIFNTPFYVYPVTRHKNQSRMVDLLKSVKLLERFNCKSNNMDGREINWEIVNKSVIKMTIKSKRFLSIE